MDLTLLLNLVDATTNITQPESRFAIGFALMPILMTALKSNYTGDLFSKLPKAAMSWVPVGVGFCLGLLNGLVAPLHGLLNDALLGALVLGWGQIGLYHTFKHHKIGDLIKDLLKTAITKPK